jgi:VanZ family protein
MRLIRGYWKTILVGLGILYVCLVRDPGISLPTFAGADKWVHVLMFTLLGIVICWDSIQTKLSSVRLWLVTMIVPMVYGGIIELLQEQYFAPRSGEWMDWLADCAGTVLGAGLVMIIHHIYHKTHA